MWVLGIELRSFTREVSTLKSEPTLEHYDELSWAFSVVKIFMGFEFVTENVTNKIIYGENNTHELSFFVLPLYKLLALIYFRKLTQIFF